MTEPRVSNPAFWIVATGVIYVTGLLASVNLREFYVAAVLAHIDDYPFGGEGPVPYYYKTPELYSAVVLFWGLLFFAMLSFGIRTVIKRNHKHIVWLFVLTVLLVLGQFVHGGIGI